MTAFSFIHDLIDLPNNEEEGNFFACDWLQSLREDYLQLRGQDKKELMSAFPEVYSIAKKLQKPAVLDVTMPLWELYCEVDPVWLIRLRRSSHALNELIKSQASTEHEL